MSWWEELTNPINKALNSNVFKGIFPVQALAQGATKAVTGMEPASQYAAGAAGGAGIAGLGALMGGGAGAGAGMTPYMPTSAPNMGAAGSTLGPGGMFSNLNPMGPGMSASAGPSSLMSALKLMRSLPQGVGQQQQPAQQQRSQESMMRMLYAMFPDLNPGGNSQQILQSRRDPWR